MNELDPGNPVVAALASQEALNRYSEACDGLTNALSYAKTWPPPEGIPDSHLPLSEFARRAVIVLAAVPLLAGVLVLFCIVAAGALLAGLLSE